MTLTAPVIGSQPSIAQTTGTAPAIGAPTKTTPLPPVAGQAGPPGAAARMIGNDDHGQVLYNAYCMYCHGKAGQGSPGIPSLRPIDRRLYSSEPLAFAESIDRIIQHGQRPATGSGQLMPALGASNALTQPQIANIEAYVLRLNGVDRARILSPGVEPRQFFLISAIVFAIGGLVLGAMWLANRPAGTPV
jgi:mono/diheme cytochrome c family protein